MKTLLKNMMPVLLLTLGMTMTGYAASSSSESTLPSTIASTQEQQFLKRLEEIKAMDPETMTKPERKAVKKEVKQIKKQCVTTTEFISLLERSLSLFCFFK